MGKGLMVEREGKHVAFSAGTGVLVFIDLVAHLILCLLQEHEGYNFNMVNKVDIKTFSLILHTSFRNENEAICLELIEALMRLCKKYNKVGLF